MLKRGDIVLIPFPFSDLSGQKIRPAIVLSKNSKAHDVILIFITSKAKLSKNDVVVPVYPSIQNGLKVHSLIVCDKIATLDKKTILGSIGTLESATLIKIDTYLKQVLGL